MVLFTGRSGRKITCMTKVNQNAVERTAIRHYEKNVVSFENIFANARLSPLLVLGRQNAELLFETLCKVGRRLEPHGVAHFADAALMLRE